jgi:hypothetical protein
MSKDLPTKLTKEARVFLCPRNATHRQYEALRAYFVEGLPSHVVAARFGYSPGSFRVLCHAFRRDLDREFFMPPSRGPQAAPKKDRARERVVALRKQNLSIYDIARVLAEGGKPLSPASVGQILEEEGFARLPRRGEEERVARARPEPAAVADVRQLDLSSRNIRTKFGGLFLFLPVACHFILTSPCRLSNQTDSAISRSAARLRPVFGRIAVRAVFRIFE